MRCFRKGDGAEKEGLKRGRETRKRTDPLNTYG